MDEKTMNQENEQKEEVNDQQTENEAEKVDETTEAQSEESHETSELSNLKDQIEKLESEKQEFKDKWLRTQADFDNFRRRTQKEKETDMKYKSQDLATEILPVLDNFERALQTEVKEEGAQNFVDGVKMVYDQLHQALKNVGVEEIQAEKEQFDPNLHQAVMQVQEEGYESNQIVKVLQKGYKLKDRVIRPAMVQVNE